MKENRRPKENRFALGVLMALFFAMGFITVLNDILVPHLQSVFDLSYFQSALVQFCFFGAYFVGGPLFGFVIAKIGFQNAMIWGFLIGAFGCLLFYPAAQIKSYPLFLGALFVLASGVVLLQTAGNPFVTLLSPGKEASALTLVQAFNSLGTTIGPIFGSIFILGTFQSQEAQSVQMPYLVIAGVLLLLAFVVRSFALLDVSPKMHASKQNNQKSLWSHRHLVLGAIAIFFYVGAEVAIGTFLINVLKEYSHMQESQAAKYIAFYWGGAMIGRFVGSAIMTKIAPHVYLAFNTLVVMGLLVVALLIGQNVTFQPFIIYLLLGIGLFNAIMFPTIFSLATKNLGAHTSQASGIICMAIVGGAIIPPIQGLVADAFDVLLSYIVAVFCYVYVLFFALVGYKVKA